MTFLLSEQRLKADFLNDNVDSALVLSAIQTAQDIYLRQTLGDSLFETICELVENNSVVEPYKTLLDDYIIVYLEYLAMSELCVTSTFKLGNIGIVQSYDSNVNSQSIQNVKYLESFYKQKASTYENRLVTYIQQNINYFPEYLATNEVVTAKESTLQTGLFLGGTKTKTIKKTTTNKNNLNGAVRYDVQQNLSEQQKEIARENIGVSGDIDINLDNYYTKDEVNTLIDNIDIPDLNNYYTKSQVNKIVDDIPIPQYTSELELDNVYSKQQTDTLISTAINNLEFPETDLSNYYTKEQTYNKSEINDLIDNVNSGEVDLSNYYKKNETYSKYEVDSLVDGVETFSGNYNDLINKPDIYTKEQVDTLIENIDIPNVDLSNYYTKQETYSKEEVDSLVANGGGSDSNMPIVDIMSLTYEEQVELINHVIDNNRFPDINTLYTYQGYVLNNLTFYSDWWDEALNQRYVVFSLYAHPKSYDIRFITYQWNEGKIYNDINEKVDDEKLITKGELLGISYNDLNDKPIVDLLSLSYDEQVNQIDFYSDINVFAGGYIMTIEGIILNGNKCVYEIIGNSDDGMPIKQVDFHINRTKDSFIIRFITRYNEANENIPYEFIYTNENGDTLDTLNLVTKYELEESINNLNIPTLPTLATVATSGDYNDLNNLPTLFSGSYSDLTDKPQIYTTEQVYNKSEIDLLFESVNTTLGNINNLLETI